MTSLPSSPSKPGYLNHRIYLGRLSYAVFLLFCLLCLSAATSASEPQPQQHQRWIMDAADDQQRFSRIEQYLRGFDQPMWEVGERYSQLKTAVQRGNSDLAVYHWQKIRKTIINGLMKRPKRRKNAERLLLDTGWEPIYQDLSSSDPARMKQALTTTTSICMACHIAEGVGFVNDQPMFDPFESVTTREKPSAAH